MDRWVDRWVGESARRFSPRRLVSAPQKLCNANGNLLPYYTLPYAVRPGAQEGGGAGLSSRRAAGPAPLVPSRPAQQRKPPHPPTPPPQAYMQQAELVKPFDCEWFQLPNCEPRGGGRSRGWAGL